jgi:EpsI family protein
VIPGSWAPAAVLIAGVVLVQGIGEQKRVPLRASLDHVVPVELLDRGSRDIVIAEDEQRVAGMTSYVMRIYSPVERAAALLPFSLFVSYYDSQMQGKTIHSPKNCLPGGGWEPLTAAPVIVHWSGGEAQVNQYLLQKDNERALVLYWYQGRGRIAHNEYAVKWDLLRDAALRGRSEEALVRIMVPVKGSEANSLDVAKRVAAEVIPMVNKALPAG